MKRSAALSVLMLGLVAGCAGTAERGEPVGSLPPTAGADRAGAPVIEQPKNLTSRASDPCTTLLTPAQLEKLGFSQRGSFKVNTLGPTCRWETAGTASRSVEASVVVTRDLFLDTYAARALPVFRPQYIGRLPAVDSQSFQGAPTCTTTVGVADGQTLDVTSSRGTLSGERETDACAISRRAAEEIVSTLPPL